MWNFLALLKLDVISHNNTGNQRFDLIDGKKTPWAVKELWCITFEILKSHWSE